MAQPSNHQPAYSANHQPGHQPRRVLTRLLCGLLTFQPMLTWAAPALALPATLETQESEVSLLAQTDTDYTQKRRREADPLWWNEQDQVEFKETVRPVEIEASRGIRIDAGRGVETAFRAWGYARA